MQSFWIKYQGTRFPLRRGETVVGRSPYCTIVLSNPLASRQHCALRLDGDTLLVTDLTSANGTWVNGERVAEARPLGHGDLIRVGTDALEVLVSERATGIQRERSITGDPRPAADFEDIAEETSTQSQAVSVELIEALVRSAQLMRRPDRTMAAVQRTLDAFLDQRPEPLSRADRMRLVAVVETLAEWSPDRATADWRDRMLTILGASDGR
jgi:pSer/pThr/pTyr-binding forkhead associated (FHA) protein